MTPIPPGRSYRIRNSRTGLYLNVQSYSLNASARLEQWPLQIGANRASQVWHVFPLDFDHYLLTNKASGLVVNVTNNSTSPSAVVEQWILQGPEGTPGRGTPAQEWVLRGAGANTHEVINTKSQLNMNVNQYSTAPSAHIELWPRVSGVQFNFQRWILEPEDEYRPVINLDRGQDAIGDIVRLTGFRQPPDSTARVLVGAMAYPYPLVSDPALTVQRQARENPYYILRKFGSWGRAYYYDHGGASEFENVQTTTVGLTTSNSTTVERTTSISVTAEASFAFRGFGASLSTTISQELRTSITDTVTRETSRTETIRRTYAAGPRTAEAIWYRDDTYVLERLDGSRVLEWRTRNPNIMVADSFRG